MERKEFVSGQVAKVQQQFVESLGAAFEEAVDYGKGLVVLPDPVVVSDDADEQQRIEAAREEGRREIQVKLDEALAKDAETPVTQAALDEALAKLADAQSELEKVKADDEADKAAIEAGRAKIEAALAALQG